ncbi:MAG: hypothetical protein KKE02_19045 [Alphaproteobacteria bacterium]|nr:hypothetical protein [Alphaproteobacteria bacterium]MBU1517214.1 hypothetical protein [Alphaproteobacteria bacterium]MBU2093250.1 hypothetical protein [Alphaproteobacteria bacterium]MBU2153124.1 hypothetical protein [Alphaproteobacteria bacterium]MBU2307830.1 hypothetical protein [Alphaproteobacteria bacterium]
MRGRATFAAVLAAHAALFLVLAIGLRPKTAPVEAELMVAPVYLADLRRKPRPERAPTPPVASARHLPVLSRPAEPGSVSPVVAAPPVTASGADEGDAERLALSRALRGSRVGCANATLLSDKERERCQDRLEQGSKLAKYIPTPIPAERRAYYDAIAKAKEPPKASNVVQTAGRQLVPQAGLSGLLASEGSATRAMGGSAPGFGCALAFGGPKGMGGWKTPPHGLKLGPLPCFVTPPSGPLSPEALIRNPDTVIKDPKKAAGEF